MQMFAVARFVLDTEKFKLFIINKSLYLMCNDIFVSIKIFQKAIILFIIYIKIWKECSNNIFLFIFQINFENVYRAWVCSECFETNLATASRILTFVCVLATAWIFWFRVWHFVTFLPFFVFDSTTFIEFP